MARGRWLCGAGLLLLWPALLNGYPLVFADTGTYLSQAINLHLGWDRPPFYSFFLLVTHWTISTWPAIFAQSMIAVWGVSIWARVMVGWWREWMIVPAGAMLAALTSLPWTIAELSPDFLTALMAIALVVLLFAPDHVGRYERCGLMALVAFAIVAHLSNLPIALIVLSVFLPMRRELAPWAAVAAGVLALVSFNLMIGRGPVIAPYGNIFLLARVVADGPGRDVIQAECPGPRWVLCSYEDALPATADAFLWHPDSPLYLAGGPRLVSGQANAIILRAVSMEPLRQFGAFVTNTAVQLQRFATGDGLQPWSAEVTPWIKQDFPAWEAGHYLTARQTRGIVLVSGWMQALHAVVAVAGSILCLALFVPRWRTPRDAYFIAAILVTLLANAAICGGLSGPHDRYQSRVMWLPGAMAGLAIAGRVRW
jgi:hypothetical protein